MATSKEQKLLEEALEAFQQCSDAESDNREAALDDLEFARLGKQWPEAVERERQREGRPCLTFNRLPSFIRQVVNDSRLNRPSIKVHPVDSGADVQTAQILNGLIRNIEVSSNADVAYDTAIESAVSGGYGYFRVNMDYARDDSFDLDLSIERIANPFTVYGDPASTEADSSDWNVAFVTDLLDEEQFEAQYPDAEKVDFNADSDQAEQSWFADEMIRVAEYWTRSEVDRMLVKLSNGSVMLADDFEAQLPMMQALGVQVVGTRPTKGYKVMQHIMNGCEIIKSTEWAGRYIPIIPVYGDEVNVEGKRYFRSLIRDAKDAQRAYNYWRTSATEKVALDTKAPWIGPRGAFATDKAKWASANTKNHAFLEYDGQIPPQRAFSAGVPAGDIQMAMQSQDDMKAIMGIYDASLGARGNETSGKAILARQREGDVSTFHFIDNLSRALRHTGRILVDLIPKVYNEPRIVRVLGEDGKPSATVPGQPAGMVPVNQPVHIDGVERVFDLTTGKYDVVVESGPSFGTRREESAQQMMEMVRSFPQAAPLIGDLIAKNLDWPGADEIAQRLSAMLPPAAQGKNPQVEQMNQQMMQMQTVIQQGSQKMQEMEQQLNSKQAETALEAERVRIEAFNAETSRIQAEAKLVESQAKASEMHANASVNTDVGALVQQIAAMQAMQMSHAPKVKRAKAVKMPDGSWEMQSVEEHVPEQTEQVYPCEQLEGEQ